MSVEFSSSGKSKKMTLYRNQRFLDGKLPEPGIEWQWSDVEVDRDTLCKLRRESLIRRVDAEERTWETVPEAAEYLRGECACDLASAEDLWDDVDERAEVAVDADDATQADLQQWR